MLTQTSRGHRKRLPVSLSLTSERGKAEAGLGLDPVT